jgi:hypothetical protein
MGENATSMYEAAGDGFETWECARCVRCGITYPCPWTTSSFASCLRLLRVPVFSSALTLDSMRSLRFAIYLP